MPDMTLGTRLRLSTINGIVTGGIATWFYANTASKTNELWQALHFHPLNFIAMILVCCGNTFLFLGALHACAPIKGWKGFWLGGVVAVLGSFLCSLVMGIGTGRTAELAFGTVFFTPISGFVGAIAGLVLAKVVGSRSTEA